jgi:iron complex outermembrane recepter protein
VLSSPADGWASSELPAPLNRFTDALENNMSWPNRNKSHLRRSHLRGAIAFALSLAAVAANAEQAETLDVVIVTGSRTGERTVQNSPAPIDVLPTTALEKANKGNLLETLNTLLPSFNLPNVATPNIGSMIRAGQLRGLNPDQTLVLVNGKRRHSTAFLGAGGFAASTPADLSLIPGGAIERIEVLRDGASALYGSDAIAGVINIITNKSPDGASLSARGGQYFAGDGLTQVYKGSVGLGFGDSGYVRLSGQIDDQEIVIRNSPVSPNFLFYFPLNAAGQENAPAGTLSTNPSLPAGATRNPREATRNNDAWINQGHAPFRLEAFTVDAGTDLTEDIELYSFASYAERESSAPQNFRHPSRDEVVRAIYPDGFTPVEAIEETDYEATVGIRGSGLFGWDWDLSSGYGRDTVDIYVRNSLNPTYGLASQTDFYIGELDYDVWTSNFDVRRSFELGVPVDLSLGVEHRREGYEMSPGDVQSYTHGGARVLDGPRAGAALGNSLGGSQALPGFRPTDAQDTSRDNTAIYAGASLHVTDAWVVDVAGRFEDYSDFGSTETARLSTRYEFSPALSVRGTVSTGFHAPALAAQSYKNTGNANTSVNHVLQVDSAQARALGSKPLEPEKSENFSVGIVTTPLEWLNVALDLYQIDVNDRIAQSTTFREGLYPGSGALVVAAGLGPEDGVSYFINAADSRTSGLELTAEATTRTQSLGTFRWTLALNNNQTKVRDVAPTPAVLAAFDIPVFSTGSQNNLRFQAPSSKQIAGLQWSYGPVTVNLRETHYGTIKRTGNPTTVAVSGPYAGLREITYDIGDLWLTDIDIGVDVTERLNLAVSVNNVFEEKPARLPEPLLAPYQLYSYTNNGPVSAAGGFYSASFTYRW